MTQKTLLVEGEADQIFFEALLRTIGYKKQEITVGPPREYGASGNGKGNAIFIFEDLLDSLNDGRVTRLGLVVDADSKSSGGLGFLATYQRIEKLLSPRGYDVQTPPSNVGFDGFIFDNRNGLPKIGIWIMPTNKADGYIEDWCLASAAAAENQLVAQARQAVNSINNKKFPEHFFSKACTSTWLAWQRTPGGGLGSLIGNKLLNENSESYKGLSNWLRKVFY
ncbi:MAG: hypothetical protein L6Q55_05075 [Azonexus sp.]|nr:DUF3226 domain-containing protein [Azonexus sp.]MCK6411783.1 hypothetical protein [Azonexus sp.]